MSRPPAVVWLKPKMAMQNHASIHIALCSFEPFKPPKRAMAISTVLYGTNRTRLVKTKSLTSLWLQTLWCLYEPLAGNHSGRMVVAGQEEPRAGRLQRVQAPREILVLHGPYQTLRILSDRAIHNRFHAAVTPGTWPGTKPTYAVQQSYVSAVQYPSTRISRRQTQYRGC